MNGRVDSDAASIGYLGVISTSRDVGLQRAAATDLALIHTPATLKYLGDLLYSTDPLTQEWAMRGLSRFVNGLPITTPQGTLNGSDLAAAGPTPYRTNETDRYSLATRWLATCAEPASAFIQHWQSWWASMKSKLAPVQ